MDVVHHRFKIGKISDSFVCLAIHHHWRLNECVPSVCNEINSILLQCQLHSCKVAFEEVEATPCNLRCPWQVHPTIHLNQIVVCLRIEIERRFFSMGTVLRIASFILADGHIGMQNVWNRHTESVTLNLVTVCNFTQRFNLFSNTVDFRTNSLEFSIIPCLLGSGNSTCRLVAFSAKLVGIISRLTPCFIQSNDFIDSIVRKTSSVMVCANHIGVFAEHPNVQHGLLRFLRNRSSCLKATDNQNRLTSKTKAELPMKIIPEMK